MTRLYIVRHGETEWNKENRTQGCSNNLPLSETGRNQAIAVADRFSDIPLDVIYSSDLLRAVETADEISKRVKLSINKTSGLREMNFGCWEGLTFNEIKKNFKDVYEIWYSDPKNVSIPNGETMVELQNRVLKTINEIISEFQGKNILIVSHGVCIKVLIFSILGMDITYHNRIRLDNTSLSIIDYKSRNPVLTLLNDTCHLNRR